MADIQSIERDSVFAKALKEGLVAGALALACFAWSSVSARTRTSAMNLSSTALGTSDDIRACCRICPLYAVTLPRRGARSASKTKRVVEKEQSAFRKSFPKIGLGLLFIYPFLVILILSIYNGSIMGGLQGSLKYVDNFGIQILIYVMLAWG